MWVFLNIPKKKLVRHQTKNNLNKVTKDIQDDTVTNNDNNNNNNNRTKFLFTVTSGDEFMPNTG